MTIEFCAGQRWTYRAPVGFQSSRLVIGAMVAFAADDSVLCCMVTNAPRRGPDGTIERVTIAFLPMTVEALRQSVVELDGIADIDAAFVAAYEVWREDPRGLAAFSVPFEGFLDVLIARQMAAIIGVAV